VSRPGPPVAGVVVVGLVVVDVGGAVAEAGGKRAVVSMALTVLRGTVRTLWLA
jgi:hypothetical protein